MKNRTDVYMLIIITISIFSNLFAAKAPKPHSRGEIEAVLARAPKSPAANESPYRFDQLVTRGIELMD
jgi:hypothetical protein